MGKPLTLVGRPPATASETAIWLLDQGLWPVVVRPGKKAPVARDWGLKRPSPAQLEAGFRRFPRAGVGLLLGPRSGVVDLEVDDPDAAGPALSRLFSAGPPDTAGWKSERGRHRLFLWDPALAGVPSVVTFAGGALELRAGGEGKQVMSVCPPTRGADGVPRHWTGTGDIFPLPDGVVRRLRKRAAAPRRFTYRAPHGPPGGVLDREAARVRTAPVGNRNATLNRAAFVVGLHVGTNRIDQADATRVMLSAAEECGLPTPEAARTIERGLDAGVERTRLGRG
jgi:hypothetical protein